MSRPAVRVVLQARVGSTRLPGKVLLPLGGIPVAALCAKRAANTGREVVLAIPDGAEDDPLALVGEAHGFAVRRGSLDDVRSRFLDAIRDLDDDAIVVRLTADNPLPDGAFVDFAVESLIACAAPYIGPEFGRGKFPHGLSAEAFRAGALRDAARVFTDAAAREHVTSGLRQQAGVFLSAAAAGISAEAGEVSCSIDRGTDYVTLRNLFAADGDAAETPWRTLLGRLAAGVPGEFRVARRSGGRCEFGEMSLGTAQIGMPYGISNTAGQPDADGAADIISTALMCGVTHLDTARMYGESERVIGDALAALNGEARRAAVVTKLPPVPDGLEGGALGKWVREKIGDSLAALRRSSLDILLLHRWRDRGRDDGAAWDALEELRREGAIGALGASVQNPDEALAALADRAVRHIQLPVNLLDWRWQSEEFRDAVAARDDVAIHARSSLLQGVMLLDAERWPSVPGVPAAEVARLLRELVAECERSSIADLAFAYVRSLRWVSTVVVGAERVDQVIANVELFRQPALTAAQAKRVEDALPALPEEFLNPALWPQNRS